jgi:methyl coenzyme M reductase subunit C
MKRSGKRCHIGRSRYGTGRPSPAERGREVPSTPTVSVSGRETPGGRPKTVQKVGRHGVETLVEIIVPSTSPGTPEEGKPVCDKTLAIRRCEIIIMVQFHAPLVQVNAAKRMAGSCVTQGRASGTRALVRSPAPIERAAEPHLTPL